MAEDRGISVLVDARGLFDASGIGRYLREVLAGILSDSRFASVLLLGAPDRLREYCAGLSADHRVRVVAYPGGFYSPLSQLAWLRLRIRPEVRADVAFFPHYDTPIFGLPTPSVVTVHDLTHFKVPEAFPAWRRRAAALLLHRSVVGAARVITGSMAAQRDIVQRFPWAASKVEVVPNGVSTCFREPADSSSFPARLGIKAPYLLCVGNRKPHKNLVAAVETLARVRAVQSEMTLVLVGQTFERSGEMQRARELGLHDAVSELSTVDDETLRALYAGCEALLFPSLYEGFGLPIVEAMACGAPVIASDRSSIPEVAGDAGLLVDPNDYGGMTAAVNRLRNEPGLRKELIRRGRKRAQAFSWEAAARQTVEVLFQVAHQQSVRIHHEELCR